MASEKILSQKQAVIDEIKDRASAAKSIVLFDYRGITDSEAKELRIKLRESNSDYKVYKNTLMTRAFNDLGIDLSEGLTGPSAFAFSGDDQIAPIKVLSEFAKETCHRANCILEVFYRLIKAVIVNICHVCDCLVKSLGIVPHKLV